jgi:AAA+ ATPase superfamily predicted ATPase
MNINPFIYSRAVLPSEFVGRETEIRWLISRLATGQSTAIIGLPHVGKTSLINYVADPHIRKSQFGHEFDKDVIRVLDAHMLRAIKSQAEFWEYALSPLTEYLETLEHLVTLQENYELVKQNNFGSFLLEQFFISLKEQEARFILFLDEFDDLLSHPVLNSAEFYGSLRSLASRSLGLVLVLGSRRDVEQLNLLTQQINPHGSPYFNVFTQITLKTMKGESFNKIVKQAGDQFNHDDVEYIKAVSGNHPLLIQTASAKLWDASEQGLKGTKKYERTGRELYIEAKQNFSDTWRVWSSDVKRVITIVALTQIPRLLGKHAFALEDDLKTLSDYSAELESLEDLGVLTKLDNRWVITQGAFLWWLTDELKRNVRDETDFKTWLQAQEMDGILTTQQKKQLSDKTSTVLSYLGKGATTLIEEFAKGAAAASLKSMGL